MPIVLGILAAAFLVFTSGKSYESTASLWVDTAPPLASSVGASADTPLAEPPAAAVQGILSELLTTRAFASSVAKDSLLGKYLGSAASIQTNAPALLENGQVVPTVTGSQILKISYSGPSPAIAESALGGVIAQLRNYSDGLTAQHNQSAIAYDSEQVKIAKAGLATARSAVTAYLAGHPGASQSDPNYLSLGAAETNAVTQLGQANAALSQATGTRDAGGWTIQVVDPPGPAYTAVRKKKMVEVILGGAFAGLLMSLLAVVALTPVKKELWEDELPTDKPFVPNVAPGKPLRTQSSATTASGQQLHRPRLSSGKRRISVRSPSDRIEGP